MNLYDVNFLYNELKDDSINAIVTDPPYLIDYKDWDKQEPEFHKLWLTECFRILKPGGTIWSFMAHCDKTGKIKIGNNFTNIMEDIGFEMDYRNTLVWARQKGRGASKHLKSQREDIYFGTKPGGIPIWNNLQMLREVIAPYVKDGKPRGWFLDEFGNRVRWTGLGNVMTYTSPCWSSKPEIQFHPAQKPIMLIERLIRLVTNEGDSILDPFSGSGTTAIASLLSNRNFIGYELNKKYYDLSIKRINEFNIFNYPGFNVDVDKKIIESIRLGVKLDKKVVAKIKNNIPKQLLGDINFKNSIKR